MNILYISSVPSPTEFVQMKDEIKPGVQVTTYGMNESGYKFHTLIQEGLISNGADITSLIGRSTSHRTHKGFFWKRKIEDAPHIRYHHFAIFNFPVLKQMLMSFSFFFATAGWLIRNHKEKEKYLLMDASYVTVLPFVLLASRFGKCRIAAIFCDIYEYMGNTKDARETQSVSILHKVFRKITRFCYSRLDGFVLLTDKMNDIVNPAGKPYIVMEGLVDSKMKHIDTSKLPRKDNVILYAGALREQYGLKNLLEGFHAYDDERATLWIYGAGDYEEQVAKAEKEDTRIHFMGARPLPEVLQKEMEAALLINPRPVDREFTRYSFPSKNMEYMVSGTPVLTTCLPGMPLEYYQYIYTIDGNTPADITQAFKHVFSHPLQSRLDLGQKAKSFVLEQKNNVIQASRILGLYKGE